MTNSAPFRVVGFMKLFFVNLPDLSYKNLYKRIQKCWLYVVWLFLLADLFLHVSRTKALNTTNLCILQAWRRSDCNTCIGGRSCTLQKGVMDYCDLSIKQLGQQHCSFNCIPVAVNCMKYVARSDVACINTTLALIFFFACCVRFNILISGGREEVKRQCLYGLRQRTNGILSAA